MFFIWKSMFLKSMVYPAFLPWEEIIAIHNYEAQV